MATGSSFYIRNLFIKKKFPNYYKNLQELLKNQKFISFDRCRKFKNPDPVW